MDKKQKILIVDISLNQRAACIRLITMQFQVN